MRIAIDIDSTLHHYWDQLAGVAARRFGVDLPYESQTSWRIERLESEQARACVEETHGAEFVAAAVPYPGAVETVNAWHAAGHFIHITSHRAVAAHDATAAWLDAIGLAHDELYCSYDKLARCQEIGIELLVDDSPVNLAGARSGRDRRGDDPASLERAGRRRARRDRRRATGRSSRGELEPLLAA